ncbi:unnamed protein product [Symbiodinium sp. CCMP2592]|nr:unnamed protein product [Symbiodinium sp. CCMP2592]
METVVGLARQPQLVSNSCGHALSLSDGRVFTRDEDPSRVESCLRPPVPDPGRYVIPGHLCDVRKLVANNAAFAALKGDGTVQSWGDSTAGGDSEGVQAKLKNVKELHPTWLAFAALREDGVMVCWGSPHFGGDASAVQEQLTGVRQICAASRAFGAIRQDGSVVAWGDGFYGGDCSQVQEQLTSVQQLVATDSAFAARRDDGTVVTWGNQGGDSSLVREELSAVRHLYSAGDAFAARREDGSIVTWGQRRRGGDSTHVQSQLRNVQDIKSTEANFAAILEDGSVISWGELWVFRDDGSSLQPPSDLMGVKELVANFGAYAALKEDGSVITWGDSAFGADSTAVQSQLRDIRALVASHAAFAAMTAEGSVISWGDPICGGDCSKILEELVDVVELLGSDSVFAAIRSNGSAIVWGGENCEATVHEGGEESRDEPVRPPERGESSTWGILNLAKRNSWEETIETKYLKTLLKGLEDSTQDLYKKWGGDQEDGKFVAELKEAADAVAPARDFDFSQGFHTGNGLFFDGWPPSALCCEWLHWRVDILWAVGSCGPFLGKANLAGTEGSATSVARRELAYTLAADNHRTSSFSARITVQLGFPAEVITALQSLRDRATSDLRLDDYTVAEANSRAKVALGQVLGLWLDRVGRHLAAVPRQINNVGALDAASQGLVAGQAALLRQQAAEAMGPPIATMVGNEVLRIAAELRAAATVSAGSSAILPMSGGHFGFPDNTGAGPADLHATMDLGFGGVGNLVEDALIEPTTRSHVPPGNPAAASGRRWALKRATDPAASRPSKSPRRSDPLSDNAGTAEGSATPWPSAATSRSPLGHKPTPLSRPGDLKTQLDASADPSMPNPPEPTGTPGAAPVPVELKDSAQGELDWVETQRSWLQSWIAVVQRLAAQGRDLVGDVPQPPDQAALPGRPATDAEISSFHGIAEAI